jgi:hypothetical protein
MDIIKVFANLLVSLYEKGQLRQWVSGQIDPFNPGEFEDLLEHPAVRMSRPHPQEKVGGDFLFCHILA